jgi:transposase
MLLQTYHYRIKDSSGVAWLNAAAKAVNYVWNYCNTTASHALKRDSKWLTGFDLNNLTAGTSKELGLTASTIQAIGQEYASSRSRAKKAKLRYRGKKSLAWVPFKGSNVKVVGNDTLKYNGKTLRYWNSMDLPGKVRCGSFGRDARGRWYINLTCEVLPASPAPEGTSVGIDLGLKTLATTSQGKKYPKFLLIFK